MRKFVLFTFSLLLFTFSAEAQFLVVDSPANVAGVYDFVAGSFGADVTEDLVYTGELFIGEPLEGCVPLTNDGTDKFVMIDRGTCNFSLKCFYAQEAGATVAIIVNNVPGPAVGMAAGDMADEITIPCIMISLDDGDVLKAEMANGPVMASFGNIIFENNLGTSADVLSVPINGSIPFDQVAGGSEFTPAASVSNNGINDAEVVSLTANIDFTPEGGSATNVYNESGTLDETLASDSTRLLVLAPTTLDNEEVGTYTVTYTLEGEFEDEAPFDNEITNNFDVTPNLYSKSNYDAETGLPGLTLSITTANPTGFLEFVQGFNIPNGVNHSIDSVTYFVSTDLASLEGVEVNVYLYSWTDTNEDGSFNTDEIAIVGVNNVTYEAGTPNSTWTTVPFIDLLSGEPGVAIPEDGLNYIVGTRYTGTDVVRFGFNAEYDYNTRNNIDPIVNDIDLPYVLSTTEANGLPDLDMGALFAGPFLAASSTGMYVNEIVTSTEDILSATDAQLTIFPNPVQNEMNVSVELTELSKTFEYRIMDLNGRLIQTIQKSNVQNETAQFNVSDLPNGQYILTVATDKGIVSETFTVQR